MGLFFLFTASGQTPELVLAAPPPAALRRTQAPGRAESLLGYSTAQARGAERGGLCHRVLNLTVEHLVKHVVLIKNSLGPCCLSYHLSGAAR